MWISRTVHRNWLIHREPIGLQSSNRVSKIEPWFTLLHIKHHFRKVLCFRVKCKTLKLRRLLRTVLNLGYILENHLSWNTCKVEPLIEQFFSNINHCFKIFFRFCPKKIININVTFRNRLFTDPVGLRSSSCNCVIKH